MNDIIENQLITGLKMAYVDGSLAEGTNQYKPEFISNNPDEKRKVLTSIEDELLRCDKFQISVAFITMSGLTPLLQTLKELEKKEIPGEILTTDYLTFSEPKALRKLKKLKNITLRMFVTNESKDGFHTKGYIFKKEEIYRIIIGSSNITSAALTCNREWNTKLVSTEQGEVAQEIVKEFIELWTSKNTLDYDEFYENYLERYNIVKKQREIAKKDETISLEKYKLSPNSMQERFVAGLRRITEKGEDRALLISATGTGKTYASAFGIRALGFKRVLFVVHRYQLALAAQKSYARVFPDSVKMGIVKGRSSLEKCKDKDFIFAMIATLSKGGNLTFFEPEHFDAIVIDETHRSPADSYQKIMNYFKPKLWLGMTATPDRRDDKNAEKNVYELFHYNIAYEIRLQKAMEENLLCPFHYFGISELTTVAEGKKKMRDFRRLTSPERVQHIIDQADYYGFSGDKVKGLIFCSSVEESKALSDALNERINPSNGRYFRTLALNGNSSEKERIDAFERLAADEPTKKGDLEPLDYILSVDLLNEGIDIIEVNQVIMLRPTQSPIVFIQQLGRGLRIAEGKEYVVVLDFIGNYDNNFMIPVALSGDRTYNKDTIRKYVISGNNTIPGASTIHFDEVSKDRIFHAIDKIKGIKTIIADSYRSLKDRLGREPLLIDFYEHGEVDPLLIIKEYNTYWQFMQSVARVDYSDKLNDQEKLILEYLSKTVISGVRPSELFLLKELYSKDFIPVKMLQEDLKKQYDYVISEQEITDCANVLQGCFVSKQEEYQKYKNIDILQYDEDEGIRRLASFGNCLRNELFLVQVNDIIDFGLARYAEYYSTNKAEKSPFVLYEKYTRRDVCLLQNFGKDISAVMFGMKRIGDDVFVFVTYHKAAPDDDKRYIEGKPDYPDEFEDNTIFKWNSKIGMDTKSSYMQDVLTASRKHLFVKKSDAESNFYYMGQFDVISSCDETKEDNKGIERPIAKVTMRMHQPVRDDILRYLKSNIIEDNKKTKK